MLSFRHPPDAARIVKITEHDVSVLPTFQVWIADNGANQWPSRRNASSAE
jgi:hypothetical protein